MVENLDETLVPTELVLNITAGQTRRGGTWSTCGRFGLGICSGFSESKRPPSNSGPWVGNHPRPPGREIPRKHGQDAPAPTDSASSR